jgi:molybdate transport system substrate-binding protein
MSPPIRIISSMATRQLLADLVQQWQPIAAPPVQVESVGGVDAARRVQAGEAFDAVVLAADAIERLIESGHIVPGSRVDLVRSGVAVAVRAGAARPDIGSGEALKRAVTAARSVGYSTGPSGVHLARLFERWGIAEALAPRIVQAPPGVPVGRLVAEGQVELGFQQLSELMHLPGIEVLGPMPPSTQIVTVFSAGVAAACVQVDAVRALLAFMNSAASVPTKHANGMQPA